MRMTRDDLSEMMRAKQRQAVAREISSEEIAQQVSAYLAQGGTIQKVEIGVCSFSATKFGGEQQSRANRAAQITRETSAEVGITVASRELGVDHKYISRCIERGEGPPFRQTPCSRSPRMFNLYTLREWGRERGLIK